MRTYVPIPAVDVDPTLQQKVRLAAGVAADRLGLPPVVIVWVIPAPEGVKGWLAPDDEGGSPYGHLLAGFVFRDSPGVIHLRADLPAIAMDTAAHEVRHLWQYARALDAGYPDHAEAEADAEAWAARLMHSPLTAQEIARWTR